MILFLNKVPGDKAEYESKARDIAYKLGTNVNWLQFLIYFESAESFSPSIQNSFDCVGLIQFCADPGQEKWKFDDKFKTIDGVKYYLKDLKAMTAPYQLDVVCEYLKQYRSKIHNFYDLYFAILWPAALGKSDDYIINTATNPIFDLNKNGLITVAEVKQFLNDRVKSKVSAEYQSEFLDKGRAVSRNIAQIYLREVIISIIIVILLVILYISSR